MFLLKNVQKYRKIYKKLVESYCENTEPVSYTHLDVYKRQFRYRTEAMNKKVKCANSAVKGHNDKNGKYRITFIFRQ